MTKDLNTATMQRKVDHIRNKADTTPLQKLRKEDLKTFIELVDGVFQRHMDKTTDDALWKEAARRGMCDSKWPDGIVTVGRWRDAEGVAALKIDDAILLLKHGQLRSLMSSIDFFFKQEGYARKARRSR